MLSSLVDDFIDKKINSNGVEAEQKRKTPATYLFMMGETDTSVSESNSYLHIRQPLVRRGRL